MSTIPIVSIVIPTYNRAKDLNRALKSVQAQTYINWEALIVDNNSDDSTDEVVIGFNDKRMKLFKINNNGVIAASRNMGINQSVGEYIAFLDSDDWWLPQKLEISLQYLQKGADIIYHDLFLVRNSGQKRFFRKTITYKLKTPVFDDLISKGNALTNSSVIVRKQILDSINGLSEAPDLIATEDYDAWLRISKITDKFTRVNKSLGYYWVGGGNTNNLERQLKAVNAIESRYSEEICNLKTSRSIYWLPYAKGRAYFKLRSFESSKKCLRSIQFFNAPIRLVFRAYLMRAEMIILKFLNSVQR